LGLALISWAFARVGVHRLSLRHPYLGVGTDRNCIFHFRSKRNYPKFTFWLWPKTKT